MLRVSVSGQHFMGMSPSGKAPDFDSGIRRFKSCHPSQNSTSENSLSTENGPLAPAVQFESIEIHKVFLRFQIFIRSKISRSPPDILISRFRTIR